MSSSGPASASLSPEEVHAFGLPFSDTVCKPDSVAWIDVETPQAQVDDLLVVSIGTGFFDRRFWEGTGFNPNEVARCALLHRVSIRDTDKDKDRVSIPFLMRLKSQGKR